MPYAEDIHKLKKIDLNTMVFFVVYMKYRKMSSVSTILKCSVATASIMLRRFCENFREVLFERKSRNLTPTLFAQELFLKCEKIVDSLCDIYIGNESCPVSS